LIRGGSRGALGCLRTTARDQVRGCGGGLVGGLGIVTVRGGSSRITLACLLGGMLGFRRFVAEWVRVGDQIDEARVDELTNRQHQHSLASDRCLRRLESASETGSTVGLPNKYPDLVIFATQVHVQSEAAISLGQAAEIEHQQTLRLRVVDMPAHAGYFARERIVGRPAARSVVCAKRGSRTTANYRSGRGELPRMTHSTDTESFWRADTICCRRALIRSRDRVFARHTCHLARRSWAQ
jgi:hypothetical protein